MKSIIKTQLSGKFSKEDSGIFNLRKKLIKAGVEIQFPFGDKIVGEHKGIPITFIPSSERTFYDIELAFFEAMKTNVMHIVHNKHMEHYGYIGESTSIEMAYAILHNKPIILLYHPTYSIKVPLVIKKIVEDNINNFFIKRIDLLTAPKLIAYLSDIVRCPSVQYDMCDIATEVSVMHSVVNLFDSYKSK
mgnify:CR=1 FL=1